MKTVLVALLVFFLISQGEALECHCGGLRHCPRSRETCTDSDNACASVIFHVGSRPSYFKGCSSLFKCRVLNNPGVSTASCCTSDLCNI
ncbi:short neurotoxin 3-like [Corythoichthys intestinalis]|uniref:short neurotoxin 3-like n=1 Tax=Corythoichthys intestinalis TaxID=161448 RepID=UPI0025A6061E|nr:short neurotoxin 3-like [Corythoichthys intestinalis]